MSEPTTERHPVYPGGPDCQPNCPGKSSMYHDGYADGYENAVAAREAEIRAAVVAARRMVNARDAWLASTNDDGPEGHEMDDAHEALRAVLAAIGSPAAPRLDRERLARAMEASRDAAEKADSVGWRYRAIHGAICARDEHGCGCLCHAAAAIADAYEADQ